MKTMRNTILLLGGIGAMSMSQAAITLATAEPTTDVLHDGILGNARVGTIINSAASQGSRGGGFSLSSGLGGSLFDLTSVTIDANNNTLAAGFEFTVSIIQAGAGGVYNQTFTAAGGLSVGGSEFATAIGGSLTGEETFAVGSLGLSTLNTQYITFEFTNAIQIAADTDYAVLVSTTGAFNQREGNNNANATVPTAFNRILFSTTSTTTPAETGGSRDMRFSITGTVVPEPSSTALLGLGGLALVLRRRK